MKTNKTSLRIGIDARFVGPQGTGLGKYTEKLIENLERIDEKNLYSLFLSKENWQYIKIKNKNFRKVLADVPWYSLNEQLKMPQIYRNEKLDLLHVPHFNAPVLYRGKFIVTIHDLIHNRFKQESVSTKNPLVYKTKRIGYSYIIKNAVINSSKIIVPSSATKKELLNYYKNLNPQKINVVYEAAEEEYKTAVPNKRILDKFNIKEPFVIYVGNAYPHKNLQNLLLAIKLLNQNETKVNLVIVSARDFFIKRLESEITTLNLTDHVILTGYLNPGELSFLFNCARAYVFPSLAEGFGIPGLNALACGLPLICSGIDVLKEIYAEAAIYFDPNSPKDISQKIEKVLKSQSLRNQLAKKGKIQAKKYSWQKMAEETLKIYNS